MDVERAQYLAGSNDCRGSDVWCWLLAAGGKGRGENCSTEKSSQCAGAGSSQLARYTSDMYAMLNNSLGMRWPSMQGQWCVLPIDWTMRACP